MRIVDKSVKSSSWISKFLSFFSRKAPASKGNNFDLWNDDQLEKENENEEFRKNIKNK
jgi:hypothetical protein